MKNVFENVLAKTLKEIDTRLATYNKKISELNEQKKEIESRLEGGK